MELLGPRRKMATSMGDRLPPLLFFAVILQTVLFYFWISNLQNQNARSELAAEEVSLKLQLLEAKLEERLSGGKSLQPLSALGKHQAVIDHERLTNFLTMKNVPAEIRNWFVYSETEAGVLGELEADDPIVLDHIRRFRTVPIPHDYLRSRIPQHPVKDYSRGNGLHLLHIFQNKTNGFFVECGAYDGLWLSNTMYLEQLLGWSGVMIEAEPNNFILAAQKLRKAHLVAGCLSITTKPMLVNFTFGHHVYSKILPDKSDKSDHPIKSTSPDILPVQCFPLHSILLSLNRTTIDFFSLDIEGNELDVLKTIPFDKIDIKVLVVEFRYVAGGKEAMAAFMSTKGYVIYPSVPEERTFQKWAEDDYIFIKKGCGYKETRRP